VQQQPSAHPPFLPSIICLPIIFGDLTTITDRQCTTKLCPLARLLLRYTSSAVTTFSQCYATLHSVEPRSPFCSTYVANSSTTSFSLSRTACCALCHVLLQFVVYCKVTKVSPRAGLGTECRYFRDIGTLQALSSGHRASLVRCPVLAIHKDVAIEVCMNIRCIITVMLNILLTVICLNPFVHLSYVSHLVSSIISATTYAPTSALIHRYSLFSAISNDSYSVGTFPCSRINDSRRASPRPSPRIFICHRTAPAGYQALCRA
jgi:hypothetical protein